MQFGPLIPISQLLPGERLAWVVVREGKHVLLFTVNRRCAYMRLLLPKQVSMQRADQGEEGECRLFVTRLSTHVVFYYQKGCVLCLSSQVKKQKQVAKSAKAVRCRFAKCSRANTLHVE